MKQLKQVFDSSQGPLSREAFNAALDGHRFGGYPERRPAPGRLHRRTAFGGTAAFANAADCAQPVSNTIGVYAK